MITCSGFRSILLFVVVCAAGCHSAYSVRGIRETYTNKAAGKRTTAIRSDGLYSLFDTTKMINCGQRTYEHYMIYSPLIFLNDSCCMWFNGLGFMDNSALSIKFYQGIPRMNNQVGEYGISNDTIRAKLPITLVKGGAIERLYMAYFEGIIVNKDTIKNWHLVAPYPQAPKKLNDGFNFLKRDNLLYFVQGKELLDLNSLYQNNKKLKH